MIIQTKGLTKTYQSKVVVDHIDLAIKEGSLTALLGPNGAGKTTIMSMLTRIINPTSGMIRMKPDIKISMVFQQSILDNDLTVMENLSIRNKLYKKAKSNHIDTLIQQIGLTEFINQKYGQLSGGQRRRVDIARALLNQPMFFSWMSQLLDWIFRLARQSGGYYNHCSRMTILLLF